LSANAATAAWAKELAETAISQDGQAWIPTQLDMEDADDDWRPF